MLKNTVAVCVDTAIIDRESNNLSLITVIDELTPAEFPAVVPQMTWVFTYEREEQDPSLSTATFILRQNDRQLMSVPLRVDFEAKRRSRVIVRVRGVQIAAEGILDASVLLEGTEVHVRTPVRMLRTGEGPPELIVPVTPPTSAER